MVRGSGPRLGAALTYYTVFALAPSQVIVIGVAGLVLGRETAQGQILEQIRDLVGEQGALTGRLPESRRRAAARALDVGDRGQESQG